MADPMKAAKRMFDEFLSKADLASMPDYDPNAKDAGTGSGAEGWRTSESLRLTKARLRYIGRKAVNSRWNKNKKIK